MILAILDNPSDAFIYIKLCIKYKINKYIFKFTHLMNFFQKIFSFLWGQKGIKDTSIDSSKSEFILVDSNKIKNILNIDKEAEGLGKMDSPSTNSKPPDATE